MSSEALHPPSDADRERRDTDFVKRAQQMYQHGFVARQSTAPPKRPIPGTSRESYDPRESLAHMAEARCPKDLPAHDTERWMAGWMDADRIGVERGHGHLSGKNPLTPPRIKRATVAKPLEMFPEAVLEKAVRMTPQERLARWENREVPKHYTTADEA